MLVTSQEIICKQMTKQAATASPAEEHPCKSEVNNCMAWYRLPWSTFRTLEKTWVRLSQIHLGKSFLLPSPLSREKYVLDGGFKAKAPQLTFVVSCTLNSEPSSRRRRAMQSVYTSSERPSTLCELLRPGHSPACRKRPLPAVLARGFPGDGTRLGMLFHGQDALAL